MMKTFHLPTIPLRRKSKGEAGAHDSDSVCSAMVEQQPKESTAQDKCKKKLKIPGILKINRRKVDIVDTPDLLDFNQNIAQNHLSEASQQLLAQEKYLFNPQSAGAAVICTENEEDRLQEDYETLMLHLRMAVNDSFNEENVEKLRSVVKVIHQQEEEDKFWEKAATEKRPNWRPLKCREIHDMLLKEVVEERLHQANDDEDGTDKLSTSLKTEVCQMGRRIQRDLLQVVRHVKRCYTPDFDVCQMYVQLYHQAFSTKLTELAQTDIESQDCIYILQWVHGYYPKDILQQNELTTHINAETLGVLLPEERRKALEEQYLSHKEVEVRAWMSNVLEKEKEIWQTSNKPELTDGCHFSNLALDVITLINGAVRETVTILGNRHHAQRILLHLYSFLLSYKKFIADLPKGKESNLNNALKASLVSIKQLREYVEKLEGLSDDVKEAWLSILSESRNSCHSYFLNLIHKDLKEQYRKLWTPAWFSNSNTLTGDLLSVLEDKIQHLSDIESACQKELVSQLHFEVMTEYVRRMFKGKVKLKDKEDQEAAACFLCEDSVRINSLFFSFGSEEKWLSSILPRLSEVLRLQDPEALQLDIVMLARTYPDMSKWQVNALLDLKSNLSKADVRSIKKSLTENRDPLNAESTAAFFSKVPEKRKLITMASTRDRTVREGRQVCV